MTETQFKMIYASGKRLGKAMAQAKELAERARGFTAIEIMVVPHPDLDAKDKRIAALEAENAKLTIGDALWRARDPFGIEKQLESENAKLRAVAEAARAYEHAQWEIGLEVSLRTNQNLEDAHKYLIECFKKMETTNG